MVKMAEFPTGTAPRYGNRPRLTDSPQVVETGWYKPVPSHGGYSIPVPTPAPPVPETQIQPALKKDTLSDFPPILDSVSDLVPQFYQAAVQAPQKPSDVRLLEPEEKNVNHPDKAEQPPARNQENFPTGPSAEVQENFSPAVSASFHPTPSTASRAEDSLSRFLSAQVCAAVLIFAAACLFKLAFEPQFLQMQEGLRGQLSDMQAVYTAAEHLRQIEENGIQETLMGILSKGLEDDSQRLAQGQAEIIISSSNPAGDGEVSSRTDPAGGEENPSGSTEDVVSSAAAAGGTYPVSMEQKPYALSVMQDGRRSASAAVLPTEGYLTCEYGPREHPITGKPDFHTGIDIGAPLGSPIYAAAAGVVEKTGTSRSLGNYLMLRHGTSTVTTYSHCSKILVKEGEAVACGQNIALVGSSGVSTGPHLHFECIVDGTLTDPAWILDLPLPASALGG